MLRMGQRGSWWEGGDIGTVNKEYSNQRGRLMARARNGSRSEAEVLSVRPVRVHACRNCGFVGGLEGFILKSIQRRSINYYGQYPGKKSNIFLEICIARANGTGLGMT